MAGHAIVYVAEDGTSRVVAMDVTTAGVSTSREPLIVAPGSSDEELGARVIDAVDGAGRVVEQPQSQTEWSARTQAFVRAMGYRSHRHLMRVNSAVAVSRDGDGILVVPGENQGIRGGYVHRPDLAIIVPSRPADVGQAIRNVVRQLT